MKENSTSCIRFGDAIFLKAECILKALRTNTSPIRRLIRLFPLSLHNAK
ncbi:MAG: hypothetical protein ACOYOT_09480 [Bacteroidales bacterium]